MQGSVWRCGEGVTTQPILHLLQGCSGPPILLSPVPLLSLGKAGGLISLPSRAFDVTEHSCFLEASTPLASCTPLSWRLVACVPHGHLLFPLSAHCGLSTGIFLGSSLLLCVFTPYTGSCLLWLQASVSSLIMLRGSQGRHIGNQFWTPQYRCPALGSCSVSSLWSTTLLPPHFCQCVSLSILSDSLRPHGL